MDLTMLKNLSNRVNFKSGQIILEEGDQPGEKSDAMYIILAGSVDVYKNFKKPNEVKIATLTSGSFFGEMALFLNKTRTATVVAAEDVMMLEINRENAYGFFEKQPEATYLLIRTLCTRLEHLTNFYGNAGGVQSAPESNFEETVDRKLDEKQTSSHIPGLFPKGHKKYNRTYEPREPFQIYEKRYTCPMCDKVFGAATVKANQKSEGMDRDMRQRFKGVDTLYYESVTCPSCLFSSLENTFVKGVASKYNALNIAMREFLPLVKDMFDEKSIAQPGVNADRLFTSLYLGLECAPICYYRPEMLIARIWMRISWLYSDCADEVMSRFAAENAQDAYLIAYEKSDISSQQLQQLQLLIGELSFRLEDYKNAQRFLYYAKVREQGSPVYRNQAEDRLDEMKAKGLS